MSEKIADQKQGGQAVVVRVVVAGAAREMGDWSCAKSQQQGECGLG